MCGGNELASGLSVGQTRLTEAAERIVIYECTSSYSQHWAERSGRDEKRTSGQGPCSEVATRDCPSFPEGEKGKPKDVLV